MLDTKFRHLLLYIFQEGGRNSLGPDALACEGAQCCSLGRFQERFLFGNSGHRAGEITPQEKWDGEES
jgi:hypothetical protein